MAAARYAVFFVPPPDSAIYRFGASALGYDSYSGTQIASPAGEDLMPAQWRELTAEPGRYGFHGTLKAPFRLRDPLAEDELIAHFAKFASSHQAPAPLAVAIDLLDNFAALVPSAPVPTLCRLADSCVREFDHFRQPMTDTERKRRLTQPLTTRQAAYLDRWGYPHVFEDFRFHMTLTGRIPPDRTLAVLQFLQTALKRQAVDCEVAVRCIALLRQSEPTAQFRIIREALLAHDPGPVWEA